MRGPSSSPYSSGKFKIRFDFPPNYPFKPPVITFKTRIYHPNIKTDTGEICTDIMEWSPTLNVKHCIDTLFEMLNNPSTENPLEDDIATLLREKPKEFAEIAAKWTEEYATYNT